MKKNIIWINFSLLYCQHITKVAFNKEFLNVNSQKKPPFKKFTEQYNSLRFCYYKIMKKILLLFILIITLFSKAQAYYTFDYKILIKSSYESINNSQYLIIRKL